jgi:hypothetical protein
VILQVPWTVGWDFVSFNPRADGLDFTVTDRW